MYSGVFTGGVGGRSKDTGSTQNQKNIDFLNYNFFFYLLMILINKSSISNLNLLNTTIRHQHAQPQKSYLNIFQKKKYY